MARHPHWRQTPHHRRSVDKALLDTLFFLTLEVAGETGRLLQIHAGWGDPDIDLPLANPVLLRPILEDPRWASAKLVVLHQAYPYVREAAFMCAVWPQVHVDLSLAIPFLGPGALGPLIELLEHTEVVYLTESEDRVTGVAVLPRGGAGYFMDASAVVLATGGVGQLYAVTTNPRVATADGWALAHHAGATLRDIEFLQFHPTALKLPGVNPAPLVSEAVRGAGALLVDREGKRFALEADPRGELAPRDIVARAVAAADRAREALWIAVASELQGGGVGAEVA